MKIFVEGVSDNIFSALWVGKNDTGGDLKTWLNIKYGMGVTNPDICREIQNQYNLFLQFEPNNVYYTRLENFFNVNIGIIALKAKKRISFEYKSVSWRNMVFVQHKKSENVVQYTRIDIKDIFQLLPKTDTIINLPLVDIFRLYGKSTPDFPLTDSTHEQWQTYTCHNIKIYQMVGGEIHYTKSLISVAPKPFDVTINLLAKDPDAYDEVIYKYNVYIYPYIYRYIYVYIPVYIQVYIRIYTCIYTYIYMYIYVYRHVYVRIYTCIYTYIYMYMYVYIHVYIRVYIHISTYNI